MVISVDKRALLIAQGNTGPYGNFHAKGRAEYGTQVVQEPGLKASVGNTMKDAAHLPVAAAKG